MWNLCFRSQSCRSSTSPDAGDELQATASIFAQTEAVRRNAGIGLLPNMVSGNRASPGVVRMLSPAAAVSAVARRGILRSALVKAVIEVDPARVAERQAAG
jgi:DNA-binding transcriptional LysR family regulator